MFALAPLPHPDQCVSLAAQYQLLQIANLFVVTRLRRP
jgi:hypothetical protein